MSIELKRLGILVVYLLGIVFAVVGISRDKEV